MDQLVGAAMKLKDKIAKNPLDKNLNEATADVNWNASNKILQEIADQTYSFNDFTEIMKFIWKKIGSERKQWRRILKTLTLIEFLIKNGSPRCIQEFRDEIYQLRSLQDFSHYEEGQDRGAAIRETSKRVVQILTDDSKIDEERKKAQEIRERLGGGHLGGIGSNSSKGGYGGGGGSYGGGNSFSSSSNRYEGYSSDNKKPYGGHSGEGARNYGGSTDKGKYDDDVRKPGKWRVEKTEESSNKAREPEKDEGGDYVLKSGTKYEVNLTGNAPEKPKATFAAAGNKVLAPPKGSKIPAPTQQQQQQQAQPQEVNFFDDDVVAPASTQTNNTNNNTNDPFSWDAPQTAQTAQPTQPAQTNDQWSWGQQAQQPAQPVQQAAPSNNGGFNWNQGQQNAAPAQPAQNLYNNFPAQQPPSQPNQFNFPQSVPQPNPQQNLASQFQQLSFNSNPVQSGGGFNANQTSSFQNNAPANFNFPTSTPTANTAPADDGFDTFHTAPTNAPKQTEYKNYTQAEKSIIDLSDITNEATKKKDFKDKVTAVKNSNEGFLYSTNEEMDNFFVGGGMGSLGNGLGNLGGNSGMGNMGGNMGGGMGMGNMGMQGNMGGGFNSGFNQGNMRNMGAPQMGGMYSMGGQQQQQQQQMGMGMNMGYNNGGNMNAGFNPMMGGNMQGGFPNQNMNYQMGGFR